MISIKDELHSFAISRKETATDIVGSSFCPTAHKLAVLNSHIHRLTTTLLPHKEFNIEVKILKDLARRNNVIMDIDRIIHEAVTRYNFDLTTSLPRQFRANRELKTIRLTSLSKVSSELSRTLRPLGFRPGYYNPLTLKLLLGSAKDRTPGSG